MLVAPLLAAAAHAGAPLPYEPDPYGWPVVYIDESYPDAGIVGGFSNGRIGPSGVVGGEQAESGAWDDAVGIVFDGYVGCTGTLVADDVVITAGHCVGGITDVIIGSVDWVRDGGEIIEVEKTVEHPDSWSTYDIAVLRLAEKSSYTPRHIALDCIIDEYLHDGAEVAVVGFGSTDMQGTDWNTKLNEGLTFIQDHDCDEQQIDGIYTGCNASVSPGGEIGAGGNLVDACYGDSGGPLYLLTPEGDFVVGVTSRAYIGVDYDYPCRDGGIYVRPDAVFDWIEEAAGREIPVYNCNPAPDVSAGTIFARPGRSGSTRLHVMDDSFAFSYEIVEPPLHGSAVVHADGEVVYTADDGYVGDDGFTVAVTDGGHLVYERSGPVTVELAIDVEVARGIAFFGPGGGCGCSQASAPVLSGWFLGLLALVGLRRR